MKLLVATTNQHKLKEIKAILKSTPYTIISPSQTNLPKGFNIKETGKTFKQNAILKAKAYAHQTNLTAIADDSGLQIDSLKGFPGVNSARFAQGNFNQAMQTILTKLKKVPPVKRTAQFICTIALHNPKTNQTHTFTAKAHGWITNKLKGIKGFGYDPIFFSQDLNQTFAQAKSSQKNQVSHRAKALLKLKEFLTTNPPPTKS